MEQDILNRILEVTTETRDRLGRVESRMDGFESRMDRMESSMSRMEFRMDKVEMRLDNIESELGTVKAAVLDIGRTVKGHDVAIKDLQLKCG